VISVNSELAVSPSASTLKKNPRVPSGSAAETRKPASFESTSAGVVSQRRLPVKPESAVWTSTAAVMGRVVSNSAVALRLSRFCRVSRAHGLPVSTIDRAKA
jgi:hypothetical protein